MCECGAMREERDAEVVEGGGMALWATGVDEEPDVEAFMTLDMAACVFCRFKEGRGRLAAKTKLDGLAFTCGFAYGNVLPILSH